MRHELKKGAAAVGLGEYVTDEEGKVILDTVPDYIHNTVNDSGANIMKAVEEFEGTECSAHTISTILETIVVP